MSRMSKQRKKPDYERVRRVGRLVRDARLAAGLSQPAVVKAAEIPQPKTLSEFELGKRWPSLLTLSRIERALKFNAGVLEELVYDEAIDLDAVTPESLRAGHRWNAEEEHEPTRAFDLTDDELLTELTRRMKNYALGANPDVVFETLEPTSEADNVVNLRGVVKRVAREIKHGSKPVNSDTPTSE